MAMSEAGSARAILFIHFTYAAHRQSFLFC